MRLRVLFVVNVDWFFLSHRLPLARAARDAGADVIVAAADTGRSDAIRSEGIGFVSIPMSRKGANPVGEVRTMAVLFNLYRRLRPDIVHHVTVKPVLYGSLLARRFERTAVVNAISGLGYVFTSDSRAKLLRLLVKKAYRLALNHPRSRTIFENPDDREEFIRLGLVRGEHAVLIRGTGVNCAVFQPTPEPVGDPLVVLPARMLWDKGVKEFVDAARLLQGRGQRARFVLVGGSDDGNPAAIPVRQLEAWSSAGYVEWWGHRNDMPAILADASVVVLPSYREGLPKVLVEAAASARPIVATDVPGCREVVQSGVNGLLVPPRDGVSLAEAIQVLLEAPELRMRLGQAGRHIAVSELSEEIVVENTMKLYRDLLGNKWPGNAGAVAI